jgi:hypothetical protein
MALDHCHSSVSSPYSEFLILWPQMELTVWMEELQVDVLHHRGDSPDSGHMHSYSFMAAHQRHSSH